MYLFDSNKDGALTFFSDVALPAAPKARSLFDALTGEEKPHSIGSLLLTLVLLLHLSAVIWIKQPAAPFTKAQPMAMEVSLIAAPHRQPAAPAPAPAQPKQEEAKKQPDKKPVKKKPLIRKQAELPKPSAVDEPMLPAPSLAESVPAPVAPSLPSRPAPETVPFTEANFSANYGSNPKPQYPGIASSRGWEGTVRLLVKVSAEGDSEEVTVQRSSGHGVLDEAAIEAVEQWKFIPAKRGETPVSSTVIVPIDFVLNH